MGEQQIIDEILGDLEAQLGIQETDTESLSLLSSKIKCAVREVKSKRNYPASFTSDVIYDDLYSNYYSNMLNLSLYDYNQVGVEGQTTHNENGTSRTWKDRNSCFDGVIAFVR